MTLELQPGGKAPRTFQCLDCDQPDPLKSEAKGWLSGELGRTSKPASIGGLFHFWCGPISNPAAIRCLPGVVILSLPARSAMFGGDDGWRFAHGARITDRKQGRKFLAGEPIRYHRQGLCTATCIGEWSILDIASVSCGIGY
jgi:hypothetical protein